MSKPYETHARRLIRKAWMCLGKAKEARSTATYLSGCNRDFYCHIMEEYSRDMAKCARGYMRQAVLYRQMNEVL